MQSLGETYRHLPSTAESSVARRSNRSGGSDYPSPTPACCSRPCKRSQSWGLRGPSRPSRGFFGRNVNVVRSDACLWERIKENVCTQAPAKWATHEKDSPIRGVGDDSTGVNEVRGHNDPALRAVHGGYFNLVSAGIRPEYSPTQVVYGDPLRAGDPYSGRRRELIDRSHFKSNRNGG